MNRRNFIQVFQAAALSTVTALQARGMSRAIPPVCTVSVDVDMADPEITDHQIQAAAGVYVRLFELDGVSGQLSGARLMISDHGKDAALSVLMGEHFLGFAESDALISLLATAEEEDRELSVSLVESFPDSPYRVCHNNGFVTLIPGEPEMQVRFGFHCFGSLKGRLAAKFLLCLRQRLAEGAEAA